MSQIKIDGASIASLQMAVQAYKTVISDYALRTKQAEEMVAHLIAEKMDQKTFISEVVNKIEQHVSERDIERSVQYLGLLQTTLMALTEIQKTRPDTSLVEVIKSLTLATGSTNSPTKEGT